MKLINVLLLSFLFTFPSVSFAVQPIGVRIANAEEKFAQVLKNTPDKEVAAVVFFTNDMSLQGVRYAFSGKALTIKGFRHGTQSYSGGYSLGQGETLDDAVVSYHRDHLLFLQRRIEIENNALSVETSPELRNAIAAHLREADQMRADFDKNGIRVIGVELTGRAMDVQDFRVNNAFVRVIELKEDGTPQPAIIP